MKKVFIISLLLSANLITAGTVMSLSEINSAEAILTIGFCLFVLVSLPIGMRRHFVSAGKRNRALYIIGYLSVFFLLLSVFLFSLRIVGALVFLLPGLTLPFVLFLPLFLRKNKQSEQPAQVHQFALFMLIVAVCISFLSLNLSRDMIESMRFSATETEQPTSVLSERNQDLYAQIVADSSADSARLMHLQSSMHALCHRIDKIKISLAAFSSYDDISSLNEYNEPDILLVYNTSENHLCNTFMHDMGAAEEIAEQLQACRDQLIGLVGDKETAQLVNDLMGGNDHANAEDWQKRMFPEKATLIAYLGALNVIENAARMAENAVLESVIRNQHGCDLQKQN